MSTFDELKILRCALGPDNEMLKTLENVVATTGFYKIIDLLHENNIPVEIQLKAATITYIQLVFTLKGLGEFCKDRPYSEEQDQLVDALQRQMVELCSDFISDMLEQFPRK